MSIHDSVYKIKGLGKGMGNTLVHIFLMVLVAFGSFLLGRLSVITPQDPSGIEIVNTSEKLSKNSSDTIKTQSTDIVSRVGKYVASKNGKLYYTESCKASNRIKEENKVYFDTATDAEKAGYAWATSCE